MTSLKQLRPLFVIVGLIVLVSWILSVNNQQFCMYFMAGFFLVFSGFKMIDLPGFVRGYQKYDLLAGMIPQYGYLYAFVELFLGLAYAKGLTDPRLHMITLGLMVFSGLGVLNAKRKNLDLRCSCLGTLIDVPLTHITLIEDFGMAAMALWMLLG